VFGRATIRLGIGPHSSFDFVFSVLVKVGWSLMSLFSTNTAVLETKY